MRNFRLRFFIVFGLLFMIVSGFAYVSGKYVKTTEALNLNLDVQANYLITFDATDGTFDTESPDESWSNVTSASISKKIAVGKTAGILPVPEKENYIFAGWKKTSSIVNGVLPEEYQEVEYIESTGSQYIDTNDIFKDGYKYEVKIVPTAENNAIMFGANSGGSENMVFYEGNKHFFAGANVVADKPVVGNTYEIVMDASTSPKTLKINNELKISSNGSLNKVKVYLFGAVRTSGNDKCDFKCAQKIYYYRVYKDNEIIKELIPCYHIDSGVVGMYDVVNDVFYENKGTDSFIAGPNVSIVPKTLSTDKTETTYYANWIVEKFLITLNENIEEGTTGEVTGNLPSKSIKVSYEETLNRLPELKRDGYTFDGWYDEAIEGNKINTTDKYELKENSTLYAHWIANTYVVSFNTMGGETDEVSKMITYDSTYGDLPIPTKTGNKFLGWSDATLPNEYQLVEYIRSDGNQFINTGLTLSDGYKFELETSLQKSTGLLFGANSSGNEVMVYYSYQHYLCGGSGISATPIVLDNQYKIILDLTTSQRQLIIDDEIVKTKTGTPNNKKVYLFGAINSGGNNVEDTINVYNKQTIYSFIAYYNNELIRYMIPCYKKGENPIAGMYDVINGTFYPNEKNSGVDFVCGPELDISYVDKDTKVSVCHNSTLFACWEKIPYDVVFDGNGGTITSPTEENEKWKSVSESKAIRTLYQDDLIEELPTVKREGYELDGWYNSTIGEGYTPVEYIETHGKEYFDIEWTPYGKNDVTINAKTSWSGLGWGVLFGAANNEDSVWFNCAVGSNGTAKIWNHVCQSGNICEFPISVNTIYNISFNYTVNTLKLNVNGEEKVYSNLNNALANANLSIMSGKYGERHDHCYSGKLYAFSIKEGNSIIYDMVPVKNLEGEYGLYDVEKGKFYGNAGSGEVTGAEIDYIGEEITTESKYSADYGTNVYAKWNANKYTLTLQDNESGEYQDYTTIEVTYDDTYKDLPTLSRTGYTFKGWYDSLIDGNEYKQTDTVKVLENKTLYAIWEEIDYTLTFDTNGGNPLDPTSKVIHYGQTYGDLPIPTRDGYTFVNWSRDKQMKEYYRVEYVETHGAEYFNTSWTPYGKDDVTIETSVMWTGSGGDWGVIFGAANSADNTWFNMALGQNRLWHHVCNSANICEYSITNNTKYDITFKYIPSTLNLSVNGLGDKSNKGLNGNVANSTLSIMAGNYGGTRKFNLRGRLYGFKLYEGDTLIYDLVPVKDSEGNYGLYDLVNYVFYDNKGNGTLTGGDLIPDGTISEVVTKDTILTNEKDQTIYALWLIDTYDLTLKDNASGEYETIDTLNIKYGDTITGLPSLTRTGYNFVGWYDALTDGNKYENDDVTYFTKDTTLYAIWEPITYTINYHTLDNENNILPSEYQKVEYLESNGNEYIDLNLDSDFTNDWSLDIKFECNEYVTWLMGSVSSAGSTNDFGVSKDSIRFGKQNKNKTFDFTSGVHEIHVDSNEYIVDGSTMIWPTTPSLNVGKKLQIFRANNSSAGQGGKIYYVRLYKNDILQYNFVPCYKTEDNTKGLYETCEDRFYGNASGNGEFGIGDEKSDEIIISKDVKYDEEVTLLDVSMSGNDEFVEWNTNSDGSGTSYAKETKVSKLCSEDGGAIDLYAIWTKKNFRVRYIKNDIVNTLPNGYIELEYLESPTSTNYDNAYIDTGINPASNFGMYIKFKSVASTNWIAGSVDSSGRVDDFGVAVNCVRYGTNYVSNLTMKDGNIHEVYVDNNGYSIDGIDNSWSDTSNMECIKPLYLFFANGSAATRGGIIYNVKFYDDGDLINNLVPCINLANNKLGMYDTKTDMFYPKTSGAIDFVSNNMSDSNVHRSNSETLSINTYTRDGYTFVGWNTMADGSGITYSDEEEIDNIITKETVLNLYAIWQEND